MREVDLWLLQSGSVGFDTGNREKLSSTQTTLALVLLSFSLFPVSNATAPPCMLNRYHVHPINSYYMVGFPKMIVSCPVSQVQPMNLIYSFSNFSFICLVTFGPTY